MVVRVRDEGPGHPRRPPGQPRRRGAAGCRGVDPGRIEDLGGTAAVDGGSCGNRVGVRVSAAQSGRNVTIHTEHPFADPDRTRCAGCAAGSAGRSRCGRGRRARARRAHRLLADGRQRRAGAAPGPARPRRRPRRRLEETGQAVVQLLGGGTGTSPTRSPGSACARRAVPDRRRGRRPPRPAARRHATWAPSALESLESVGWSAGGLHAWSRSCVGEDKAAGAPARALPARGRLPRA